MPVQIVELGEIEPCRGAANGIDIEPFDRLLGGDDLFVAMAPAEAKKIIAQGFRQIAEVTIGLDAERAMPFRQLRPIRTVDQRQMGEFGSRPTERVRDLLLAKRIVEVVVT